ncbi:MAG: hypothetical protein QOG80_1226, partial [Pseudonocardiales bacterium]|nr:hypothetical protein [Pseudonocardiales bacterium]
TDPPLHHEIRKLLNPFFHPKRLAESEDVVRRLARQTMAPWIESGRCDVVSDYAAPFVTDVLATVIFQEDDLDVFRRAEHYNGRVAVGDASAFAPFYEELTAFVDRRRAQPREDDIVTTIINGTVAGRALTEAEQIGCVLILFAGGLDTTKVAIANIVARLAADRSLEDVLRTAGWERRALDEFLRLDTPVVALGRVAVQDAILHGRPVMAGERVDVYFASANRDEQVFGAPDQLDLGRERNPHVAFGLGVHRCIGMHLARLQIKAAVEELLARATHVRLQAGTTLHRRPGVAQVFEALPIEFDLVADSS